MSYVGKHRKVHAHFSPGGSYDVVWYSSRICMEKTDFVEFITNGLASSHAVHCFVPSHRVVRYQLKEHDPAIVSVLTGLLDSPRHITKRFPCPEKKEKSAINSSFNS